MTRLTVRLTRLLAIGCVLLVAALLVPAAVADDPGYPTKWSQPPDLETGVDINSMEDYYISADDFLCESPLPVHDVHWWGSYWMGDDPQNIKGFTIRFFSDIVEDFSHPDVLLYEQYIPGNCNETYYGYCQNDGTNVYQYDCILPEPFHQTPGTVYWLSVKLDPDWVAPPYWGWHTSAVQWNDIAVQAAEPAPWNWAINDTYKDLAFELTVIPEPSTLVLLGLGVTGLLLRRRRRS